MPSANQYITLPAPTRGLCNKGDPQTRPQDTFCYAENWMASQATDGRLVTRWGVKPTYTPPGSLKVVYIGDGGMTGMASPRVIVITKNNGAGTNGGMYWRNGAVWTDLSGGVGLTCQTNTLTWDLFDKAGTVYFLFSNGVEVKKWDRNTANPYAAFAASPEAYKASMVVADRLVVGNLATSGTQWVDCSSAADFEAGWNINMVKLATTTGPITAMHSMGATQGVIYCEDAIYMCIPQTGPAPFRYELRASGIAGPGRQQAVVQATSCASTSSSRAAPGLGRNSSAVLRANR